MAHVSQESALGLVGGFGGFLRLLQLFFRLFPHRDIHQGSLMADHASKRVANRVGIVDTDDRRSVFPPQRDFPHQRRGVMGPHALRKQVLRPVEIELADVGAHEFIPVGVSQHANHRRIHIQQTPSGIAEIDAFLERFKQLGKARFAFALRGNISRQAAGPDDFAVLYNRLQNAIEIKHRARFLQARSHRAGPAVFSPQTRRWNLSHAPVAARRKTPPCGAPPVRSRQVRKPGRYADSPLRISPSSEVVKIKWSRLSIKSR